MNFYVYLNNTYSMVEVGKYIWIDDEEYNFIAGKLKP